MFERTHSSYALKKRLRNRSKLAYLAGLIGPRFGTPGSRVGRVSGLRRTYSCPKSGVDGSRDKYSEMTRSPRTSSDKTTVAWKARHDPKNALNKWFAITPQI
jgi:hypothetical protein